MMPAGLAFTPDIFSLAVGGVIGLLAGLMLGFGLFRNDAEIKKLLQQNAQLDAEKKFVETARTQMSSEFKALSLEALNASRDNFLALAQEKFTQMQGAAQADVKQIVNPVTQTLLTLDQKITLLEKERHGAYGELKEYLRMMRQDQEKLRSETSSLVQALRSPATRGQWGEMQLKRTLEMAGLVEGVHFNTQVSIDSQRPDVVVKLPGGKSIVIDAKTPIDAYLDALKEGATEADRTTALDRHARHVRDHLRALGAKAYWEKFDSPEFVIMFLPGESYYSAALERDPSLLEAGVDQKVIPASPTTLIALLKAVAYGWQQEKLAENAREISEMGATLYKRLVTFSTHLEKIGKGLNTAVTSYNGAMGSFTARVLPAGRDFQKLQNLTADEKLPDAQQIDVIATAAPDMSAEEEELKRAHP
jgi:DNA recombination protein RmuC